MPALRDRLRHHRVRRLLDAHLDVELDADTAIELADHLAACETCRTDADVLLCIKAVLARRGGR